MLVSRRGSTAKPCLGFASGNLRRYCWRGELHLPALPGPAEIRDLKFPRPGRSALVGAVGFELEGQPDVGFGGRRETGFQHADDGVRLVAHGERFADDIRIAAKFALPQAVTRTTTLPPSGAVFLRLKVRPSMTGAPKRRK